MIRERKEIINETRATITLNNFLGAANFVEMTIRSVQRVDAMISRVTFRPRRVCQQFVGESQNEYNAQRCVTR